MILVLGLISATLLVRQTQNIQKRAASNCPANGAYCQWDAAAGAASYRYVITDVTSGKLIIRGTTTETLAYFTAETGQQYRCVVTPLNSCGAGGSGTADMTCAPPVSTTPALTSAVQPALSPASAPSDEFPTITPLPSLAAEETLSPQDTQEDTNTVLDAAGVKTGTQNAAPVSPPFWRNPVWWSYVSIITGALTVIGAFIVAFMKGKWK